MNVSSGSREVDQTHSSVPNDSCLMTQSNCNRPPLISFNKDNNKAKTCKGLTIKEVDEDGSCQHSKRNMSDNQTITIVSMSDTSSDRNLSAFNSNNDDNDLVSKTASNYSDPKMLKKILKNRTEASNDSDNPNLRQGHMGMRRQENLKCRSMCDDALDYGKLILRNNSFQMI